MRSVVLVAALWSASGCGKRINPAWCQQAENQSAAECPAAIADAQVQETACHDNSDCARDPLNHFCDTAMSADVCVECLDNTNCADPTSPICTTDHHVCLPCQHDFECGTGGGKYCQDGQCYMSTDAYYASPQGHGDPNMCLQATPCSLADGLARAISGHKVLRLIGDGSGAIFHVTSPITLGADGPTLRISGVSDPTTRIAIDGGGTLNPVIKIIGGTIELDFLTVQGAKGAALACSAGNFVGRRLYIHDLADDGQSAAFSASSACKLTLDASVITTNKHGALNVSGGSDTPFEIHNNVFAKNTGGPAVTLSGNGRFEYNTVDGNHGKDGTSGVLCNEADGVRLDMNILSNNRLDNPPTKPNPDPKKPPTVQPAPQYVGCTMEHGFSDDNADLQFGGGSDPFTQYRLTPPSFEVLGGTPLSVVNISDVVCAGMTDIDMTPRPAYAR